MAKTKGKGKIHPKYLSPVKTHDFKHIKMPPKPSEILDTPQKVEAGEMQVEGSNVELMARNDNLNMGIASPLVVLVPRQEKGETELQSEAMDEGCGSHKEETMEKKYRHDDKEENCYVEGVQVLDTGGNKDGVVQDTSQENARDSSTKGDTVKEASEQMQVGDSNEELMARNDNLNMRILSQQEKGETKLQSESMDERCGSDKEEAMEERNRHFPSGHDDKEEKNCYMEGAQVLDTGNNKDGVVQDTSQENACDSSTNEDTMKVDMNVGNKISQAQLGFQVHEENQVIMGESICISDGDVEEVKHRSMEHDQKQAEESNQLVEKEICDTRIDALFDIEDSTMENNTLVSGTDGLCMETHNQLNDLLVSQDNDETYIQEQAVVDKSMGMIDGHVCASEKKEALAQVHENRRVTSWDDGSGNEPAKRSEEEEISDMKCAESLNILESKADVTIDGTNSENQQADLCTETDNQLNGFVVSQENDETHVQEHAVVDKSMGMIDDPVCTSEEKEAMEQVYENRRVTSWDDGSGNEPAKMWGEEEISDMKCAESLNIVESKANVTIDGTNSENQQADFALMEEAAVQEVVPEPGSLEGREENVQENACFSAESCGQILSSGQLEGVGGGCSMEAQIVDATVVESDDIPKDIPPIKHAYPGSKVRSVGSHVVRRILPHHAIDHSSRNALSKSGMHIERVPQFYPENACKNESVLNPLAPESDSFMNFASSSFQNALEKEVTHMNDALYEDVDATRHSRGINCPDEQSHELDQCVEQVEIWVSKLKSAANRECLSSAEKIAILQKRLEEQIKVNQRYQILSHQEELKRKREIGRYERELHLMDSVLNDYRKAMKKMQKSDAKRARQDKQLDESLYRDHPDGKGKVITVAEWEKLIEERKIKENRNVILESMKNFYLGSVGKLGEHFQKIDMLCSRLSGCQDSLNQLKAKAVGPKSLD